MKKITKWYKITLDENGKEIGKSFNHYNEGWVEDSFPPPFNKTFTNQLAWKKDNWLKEYAYITDDMKIVQG